MRFFIGHSTCAPRHPKAHATDRAVRQRIDAELHQTHPPTPLAHEVAYAVRLLDAMKYGELADEIEALRLKRKRIPIACHQIGLSRHPQRS